MTTPPLPAPVFARLARLSPAPDGLTTLRSALHARRLLLLKALLVRVHRNRASVEPGALDRFERSWELLERVERRRPAVVRDVLDYPTTGAWLAGALAEPAGPAFDGLLGHLDHLAVTAALRAGGALDVTVETPDGLLSLPGVGRLSVAAERVRVTAGEPAVRFHPDGARQAAPALLTRSGRHRGVLVGRGPGWRAVRPLHGGAACLDDVDPYRVPSGAGGTVVVAADPAETDHAAWTGTWRAAHHLLARTHPGRAAEVSHGVRAVVPVLRRGPRHVGATLSAAPGAVLTSLPADGLGMAETLVHELHHSKLATLHELVPLYGAGPGALYRVGWRSDPRPLAGVLHGAYAHLALAELWRRTASADGVPPLWRRAAGQQFDDIHDQVGAALRILLESDELTVEGGEFVRQMRLHHASLGTAPLAAG
ncbi:aKG-HExxH-type peptide beta-hydroxylase [Streptomyces sp. NPDC091368]|uniref:aKG-HExxH-type peptide beta-hydroxylase n=1 Tax=Streptomyces sp. NPDC091368 TaxID=3365993 RepID=UPI003807FFBA